MAEMSVRMTLTLADTASPGLRAFMALLDQLGPKVTGLSNRLNTLETNLTKVGVAAQKAASGGLYEFDKAASQAEASAARFGTVLTSAVGAIQNFERAARAAAAMAAGLAAAWNTIAAATANAAAQMASATANMAAANSQIGGLTTRVHSLTHSLQGLAEAWAATKLFKAGEASVNEASDFQQLEARIKALNRPQGENDEIIAKSRQLSRQLGFISLNQATEARIGAIAGLGHNDPEIIDKTLPSAVKVAAILRARGDTTSMSDLVRNLYGLAEARGQTSDVEGMVNTFNLVQKNAAATGMKLTTKDLEAIARQMKYGTGAMVSDEGIVNAWAYANQLKASGTGGGGSGGQGVTQAGTALTQVAKWALGGITNKETARLLTAMGIMDPDKIRDDSDTTKVNIGANAIKDSEMAVRDPMGWLMKMAPIFLAFVRHNPEIFYPKGTDPNDPRATDEALTRLGIMLTGGQGGVNVGNMLMQAALAGPSSRIKEESKLTFGAKDTEAALSDVDKTYLVTTQKFEASLKSLQVAIGEKLLPMLTSFLEKASEFVRYLNEIANANPAATTITTIAIAIGAVALALSGLNRLFGIYAALGTMMTALATPVASLGASFTAAAAAATAATSVIGAVWAALMVVVTRVLGPLGAFLFGWDVGLVIAKLEVDGQTIHEWAVQWMAKTIGIFERGWIRVKAFFGLISEAQKDAELKQSEATQAGVVGGGVRTKSITGAPGGSTSQVVSGDLLVGGKKLSSYNDADQAAIRAVMNADKIGQPINIPGGHATPEEIRRKEMEDAAAGITTGPYDPNAKKPKRSYNEEAGMAFQDYRVERSAMENDLKKLDAQFKSTNISVQDYFDKRQSRIIEGYADEIANLTDQLEALRYPKKGPVDQAGVDRVQANLDIKRQDREAVLEQNEANRTRELTELDAHRLDVQRQLEAVSGRRHRAEIMRLQELTQKRYKEFVVNNDPESAAAVLEAGKRGAASIEFDQIYTGIKASQDFSKSQEEDVAGSVKAAYRTQNEAEREIYELRRQSAAQVQEMIGKLRELAEASHDERLIKLVNDMAVSTKSALTALSPEILKIKDVMESSFTDFFNGLQNRTKGFKGLIMDLLTSIQRGLSNLASQALSQQLGKAIFGNVSPGSTSLLGGLGNVASGGWNWLTSLFGGGGPELLNSFAGGIPNVPRDMLAVIHKDERVLTAAENLAIKQGGGLGSDVPPVYNTFILQDAASSKTQNQIASRVTDSIERARRNR